MSVFALWSAPRARSTAFFRSMVERGDLLTLHEPFCNIMDWGETDVAGQIFTSSSALLRWLQDECRTEAVFLKDTTDRRHDAVLADERFLAEGRHAFLIRRPEEVAASFWAIRPEMGVAEVGLELLHEMYEAVLRAGGHRPVVIDSHDLVARPQATMAEYCAAVGLPFLPGALSWEASDRSEWRRTAKWHTEASASSGFHQRDSSYDTTVENSDQLAAFAHHHRPFYAALFEQRLRVEG